MTSSIEQSLQDYLNKKNVPEIFKDLMENILTAQPENPVDFIYSYLPKKYPHRITSHNSNVNVELPGALVTLPSSGSDLEDTPSHYFSPKVIKPRRKTGISAESLSSEKLQSQLHLIANIPKSPDVITNLLRVVERSPLLRTLDEESMDLIVKAFSGPIVVDVGTIIIQQGDTGDVFYLLESGEVDVFVNKGDNDSVKVHTYLSGDSFGELALMYNAPRAATCRAKTNCKLWSLDRISFKCIVVAAAMHKREIYCGFLKEVPILKSLTDMEILTLSDALAEEKYLDGDLVCKQGDEGRYFYIIKDGEAECTIEDKTGTNKIVASLTSGSYFGEVALLTCKPRQATVQAKGTLHVLALDRATFTRVLGSVEDVMMRNMEEYKKFAAHNI